MSKVCLCRGITAEQIIEAVKNGATSFEEVKEETGTAAVITPIGGIEYKEKLHVFYSETEVGPITKELYRILCGIQFVDIEGPEGWIYKVK